MTGEIPAQRAAEAIAEDAAFRTHRVPDQHQTLEFDGRRIGFASTETEDTTRWTEIEVFVTRSGKYVVHRVGVSLTYHAAGAPCASGSLMSVEEMLRDTAPDDIDAEHVPCEKCKPAPASMLPPTDNVRRETDRHSADAVANPPELIKALSLRRPNGSSYLSAVARDALSDAARHDTAIGTLMNTTVRID